MMGNEDASQGKLFYTTFNLEKRVRANHPLRRIVEVVDFRFVYNEVRDKYGKRGNVSIPPPVILKLMLLLVFYNVRSERELMDTLPERLDWLWFLGYDLDDDIPNHSVLSKARSRWGVDVFKSFFERIVFQCVEAGLVDGTKIFVDSSLVDADASSESIVDTHSLKDQLSEKYKRLETRLAELPSAKQTGPYTDTNARCFSATDPDAALVRRGTSRLRYQVHRVTEGQSEIITATKATPGDVNEGHYLMELAEIHETNTGTKATTLVADSKYGTKQNYLTCHDQGLRAHMPPQRKGTEKRLKKRGFFTEEKFQYDAEDDVYVCPNGERLKRRSLHKARQVIDYAVAKGTCDNCVLRDQCTENKTGRTIARHVRQLDLDAMHAQTKTRSCRRDLWRRQHVSEGSFGNSKRYGYKRARWRRLWRVEIQDYLTCAVQNITQLMKATKRREAAAASLAVTANLNWVINIATNLKNRFVGFIFQCESDYFNFKSVSLVTI